MPKLVDLISRFVFTEGVYNKFKPSIQKMIQEEAAKVIDPELAALPPLLKQGTPVGMQMPAQQVPGFIGSNSSKPQTGVSFQALRDFSVFYWAARACIGRRQEQIANLTWDITPIDNKDKSSASQKAAEDIRVWFKNIGGPNRTFRHFLDMVIEDLLVLDGSAIYKVKNNIGDLMYLHPIDGSTIRLVVDKSGMLVQPPGFAYYQYIRGRKVAEMTTEEMIYAMMNPRTNTAYGLSPLESLVIVIQSALRSELSNLAILQEGNVPEGFIQVPPEWTVDQIKAYDDWFNAILAGNVSAQRRIKMIPGGKGSTYIPTKKPVDMEFKAFEEWMTIKTCALFGVSPQSIGITWDLNKATSEEQSVLSQNESVQPLANFIKEIFDMIIQVDLGYKGMQFKFLGFDSRDEKKDSEINSVYINSGVKSINEVRVDIGEEPIDGGDEHFIMTPGGPMPVKSISVEVEDETEPEQPKEEPPVIEEKSGVSIYDDLKKWQTKAINDLKRGKPYRKFSSVLIDDDMRTAIESELVECKTVPDIKSVFKNYTNQAHSSVIDYAMQLADELEVILKSDGRKPTIKIEKKS